MEGYLFKVNRENGKSRVLCGLGRTKEEAELDVSKQIFCGEKIEEVLNDASETLCAIYLPKELALKLDIILNRAHGGLAAEAETWDMLADSNEGDDKIKRNAEWFHEAATMSVQIRDIVQSANSIFY